MNTTGRKEVCEAVLIAALVAVAQGIIGFGVEEMKKHVAERREAKRPKSDPKEEKPDA